VRGEKTALSKQLSESTARLQGWPFWVKGISNEHSLAYGQGEERQVWLLCQNHCLKVHPESQAPAVANSDKGYLN